MQKTISIIVFLAFFEVIRSQDNTKTVEDLSEHEANDLSLHKHDTKAVEDLSELEANDLSLLHKQNTKAVEDLSELEANDLSLIHKYKTLLKKMLNYGVPFFEGKKSRDDIIKYFQAYPSTSKRPPKKNITVKKTKENSLKDEDEIRRAKILLIYKKFLENLLKYGVKILKPNKETTNNGSKREYSASNGRTQYIENDKEDYNKYLDKYKIPGRNTNKESYTG